MLKVLVTGASGFVGSHIIEALNYSRFKISCLLRKTSNLSWLKTLPVEFKLGDFQDVNFLSDCVKDADVVVHCAGAVRAFNKEEYFKVNVSNTKNLCDAVVEPRSTVKKFIFISSQAAMGPGSFEKERKLSDPESPVSDYGLSKLAAENEIKNTLIGNIPYTILRPAAVYGPRDKDIFIFFNLVRKHLRPFTLRKRVLQLVYVKDVAKAVVSCIDNPKTNNKTYYLAEQMPYTWEGVAEAIADSSRTKTIPLPLPDLAFKAAGIIGECVAAVTGKPAVLNKQKINEMLQDAWTAETTDAYRDLTDFTKLEIASKITYNWYLHNGYF